MVSTSLIATPNTIMASQSVEAALVCETDPLILLLVKQLLADPGQSLVAGVAGVLLQLAGAHLGVITQVLVLLAHSSIAVVAVQRESLEEGSDENGPQNTYCVWGLGKSDLS